MAVEIVDYWSPPKPVSCTWKTPVVFQFYLWILEVSPSPLPHTLLGAWRPEFLSRGGVWPWCGHGGLSLISQDPTEHGPTQSQSLAKKVPGPTESHSMFLLLPLLCHFRSHCPFSAKALEVQLQRGLASQPGSPTRTWRVSTLGTRPCGLELVGCVPLWAGDQITTEYPCSQPLRSPLVSWFPPFFVLVLVKLLAATGLI